MTVHFSGDTTRFFRIFVSQAQDLQSPGRGIFLSVNTVSLYLGKARDQGFPTLKDLDALDDTAVTQGLMQITEPSCDGTFKIPNFDYVHAELAKPHVTLKLLWEAGRLTMPPKLFNF